MNGAPATIGDNSSLAAYAEFRDQLAALRKENESATFDYANPKGNKEARSHIYKLRQTRAAVEKARKKEKAESLEYGRRVDEQAKQIMAEIDGLIEVHAKPIEEIEQREKDRIAHHRANLAEIVEAGRVTAEQWLELPLQAMRDRLSEIEADQSDFEEFADEASAAKSAAVELIRGSIAKRETHDTEQAELSRLRAEEESRQKAAEEERLRKEGERKAAERAEQKAKQEREAAERREADLRLAAEKAEREKAEANLRAERAQEEADRRAKAESEARAKRDADEAAKREADKKHRAKVNNDAAAALVAGGLSQEVAKQAITLIAQRTIPNVSISY